MMTKAKAKQPRSRLRTLTVFLLLLWLFLFLQFYFKLKPKPVPLGTGGVQVPVPKPVIDAPPLLKTATPPPPPPIAPIAQEHEHENQPYPQQPQPQPQPQPEPEPEQQPPLPPLNNNNNNKSAYAARYAQDIQPFMIEYASFEAKNVRQQRCDESQGFFLSADGKECVTSCPAGEALAEAESGEMQCVAVRSPESYDGAFAALHVYKGPGEDPDYETHLRDLRRWLGNVAGYNRRFGTCYHALVFHYGPGLWWRNVFGARRDFRCPGTGEPMTYWVDVSADSPFAVPPQARALGVTESTVGTVCQDRAWPPAYAYMIRFRVALMWDRALPYWPVVAQYKVIFQLDGDCVVANVRRDPIRVMLESGYVMGYYMCAVASSLCTRGSWDFVKTWARAHDIRWPKNGMRKDLVFMGGMVLYSPALFGANELALDLLTKIDESGNIYKYRWPEHLYYTVVPYLFDRQAETCYLGELFDVYHHNDLFKRQTCPRLRNACVYNLTRSD